MNMKSKDYYVYGIFCEEVLVYIGKGKRTRYKDHLKGRSSSVELNRLYFTGKVLTANKLSTGMCETSALFLENQLINNPCFDLLNINNSLVKVIDPSNTNCEMLRGRLLSWLEDNEIFTWSELRSSFDYDNALLKGLLSSVDYKVSRPMLKGKRLRIWHHKNTPSNKVKSWWYETLDT